MTACKGDACMNPRGCDTAGRCVLALDDLAPVVAAVTLKAGLAPHEVKECHGYLRYKVRGQHHRWVSGALLWMEIAIDTNAGRATELACAWSREEKGGGLAMAWVVTRGRNAG